MPMQKFEYRSPRTRTDFPISIVGDGLVVEGRCTDISTEGLGAVLVQSTPAGTIGTVTLTSPTVELRLLARVAYCQANRAGLAFLSNCDDQRASILRFLETVPSPVA